MSDRLHPKQPAQHHADDWTGSIRADKRRPLFALAGSLYLLVALLRESAVRAVFDPQIIAAPSFPSSYAISVQAIQVALLAPIAWLLLAALLNGDVSYKGAFHTRFRTVAAYLLRARGPRARHAGHEFLGCAARAPRHVA